MNLDLEDFNVSKRLKNLLGKDALTLPEFADAYLEISRTIHKILIKYHKKWRKLKKRFVFLLKLIENIQKKKTIISAIDNIDFQDRNIVFANKDQTLKNLDFYATIMQKMIETKLSLVFSSSALIISIVSIILSFILSLFRV